MTVTQGKERVFLGMHISYLANGTTKIRIKEYLKEAIDEFGKDITKLATSPAQKDLFEVDEESELLDRQQQYNFHSVAAKLLYVSQRARLDIQLSIAFLCARISCSTK